MSGVPIREEPLEGDEVRYPASAMIRGKSEEPCFEYDTDCRGCAFNYPDMDTDHLPPHCGVCGYVREDHPEEVTE